MLEPLPKLPSFPRQSPHILTAMTYAYQTPWWIETDCDEFYWFSREYGRILRHHFNNIDYRLANIYKLYEDAHKRLSKAIEQDTPDQFGQAFTDMSCNITHWEFESLLNAAGASLDIIARLVGPAYQENSPPSFSKLCKKKIYMAMLIYYEKHRNFGFLS